MRLSLARGMISNGLMDTPCIGYLLVKPKGHIEPIFMGPPEVVCEIEVESGIKRSYVLVARHDGFVLPRKSNPEVADLQKRLDRQRGDEVVVFLSGKTEKDMDMVSVITKEYMEHFLATHAAVKYAKRIQPLFTERSKEIYEVVKRRTSVILYSKWGSAPPPKPLRSLVPRAHLLSF